MKTATPQALKAHAMAFNPAVTLRSLSKPDKRPTVLVQAIARKGVACFHPQFSIDEPEFRATVHLMASSADKSREIKALLQAAPQLLEALKASESALSKLLSAAVMAPDSVRIFPPYKLGEHAADLALDQARAAIARATL